MLPYVVCFHKLGEILEPETGAFLYRVSEHPRMYDLVRLSDFATDYTYGILQANLLYRRIE